MKTFSLTCLIAFLLVSSGAHAIDFIFDYQLPLVVVKARPDTPSEYTTCTVKSFIFEGARYYQTYLTTTAHPYALVASASVDRGTFTAEKFEYEDTVPAIVGLKVLHLKNSTSYILDKDLRIIRSEMKATSPTGEVIYQYVCQDKNYTS